MLRSERVMNPWCLFGHFSPHAMKVVACIRQGLLQTLCHRWWRGLAAPHVFQYMCGDAPSMRIMQPPGMFRMHCALLYLMGDFAHFLIEATLQFDLLACPGLGLQTNPVVHLQLSVLV